MRPLLFLLLLTSASCSTVANRRDDPPDLVRQTSKSVAEFRSCFLPQFERSTYPVAYVPTAKGETYTQGVPQGGMGTYTMWVVDVTDLGSVRQVTLHAIHSVWGPNAKLARQVEACL